MKKTYIYNNYCRMNDGSEPLGSYIFNEDNYDSMISRFHQDLASAYANPNVLQICITITYLQVTDNLGMENEVSPFIIKSDGFNRIPFEKSEETEKQNV